MSEPTTYLEYLEKLFLVAQKRAIAARKRADLLNREAQLAEVALLIAKDDAKNSPRNWKKKRPDSEAAA